MKVTKDNYSRNVKILVLTTVRASNQEKSIYFIIYMPTG